MKHLLLALLLFHSLSLLAQKKTEFAVRAGAGASYFTGLDQTERLFYFSVGGSLSHPVTDLLKINAEALLSTGGSEYYGIQEVDATLGIVEPQPYQAYFRVFSLDIPVYPSLNFDLRKLGFRIYGGPSMSFNYFGFESREYVDPDVEDVMFQHVDRIDPLSFSVLYGASVKFPIGNRFLLLDVRYAHGLSTIYEFEFNELEPAESRMNYYLISVNYLL